jgi:hypothetical protein
VFHTNIKKKQDLEMRRGKVWRKKKKLGLFDPISECHTWKRYLYQPFTRFKNFVMKEISSREAFVTQTLNEILLPELSPIVKSYEGSYPFQMLLDTISTVHRIGVNPPRQFRKLDSWFSFEQYWRFAQWWLQRSPSIYDVAHVIETLFIPFLANKHDNYRRVSVGLYHFNQGKYQYVELVVCEEENWYLTFMLNKKYCDPIIKCTLMLEGVEGEDEISLVRRDNGVRLLGETEVLFDTNEFFTRLVQSV